MSDISVLSKQYDTLAKLFRTLNEAVLLLKKEILKGRKTDITKLRVRDSSEIDKAQDVLKNFLDKIISMLNQGVSTEPSIPYSLVKELQTLCETEPYFEEELRELHSRLSTFQELRQEDLEIIDKVLAVIESDREAVFHKLLRKR